VIQALRNGIGQSQRRSAMLERDLLYVAVPSENGVARVALSVIGVQEWVNGVLIAVAAAMALAAALAVGAAVVVARVTASPILTLTRGAQRLAGGDLDHTIPVVGRDEVSQLGRVFNDMAGALRAHVQAVEDERGRLAAVLSAMGDGLVITDAGGVVRLINPAAAHLLESSSSRAGAVP